MQRELLFGLGAEVHSSRGLPRLEEGLHPEAWAGIQEEQIPFERRVSHDLAFQVPERPPDEVGRAVLVAFHDHLPEAPLDDDDLHDPARDVLGREVRRGQAVAASQILLGDQVCRVPQLRETALPIHEARDDGLELLRPED